MIGVAVMCCPVFAMPFAPVEPSREMERPKPVQPEAFGLVAVYLKGSSDNAWANYWESREMRIATRLEF